MCQIRARQAVRRGPRDRAKKAWNGAATAVKLLNMQPPVTGILETALYVVSVERSVEFYEKVFGFEILTRGERICAMSVAGRGVLLIFKIGGSVTATRFDGGVIPPTDGDGDLHLTFSIERGALDKWTAWLADNNVAIESTVTWARGGVSVYFRDPDNHLLELATPGVWAIY